MEQIGGLAVKILFDGGVYFGSKHPLNPIFFSWFKILFFGIKQRRLKVSAQVTPPTSILFP